MAHLPTGQPSGQWHALHPVYREARAIAKTLAQALKLPHNQPPAQMV